MPRLMRTFVAAVVLLTPVVLLAQEKADKVAESGPPAGAWKLYLPFLGEEGTGNQPRYVVKFSQKDGKWSGSVASVAQGWPKAMVEKVVVADKEVRFVLQIGKMAIACEAKPMKDGKASNLYGTATIRKRPSTLELEPTSLDPFVVLEARFAKEPPGHAVVPMGLNLLGQSETKKLDPKLVRSFADKIVKSAGLYGPSFQRDALLDVARTLNEEAGYEKIGLEYARRAEKTLDAKESPSAQKRVLDVFVQSLEKTKREEEVKTVQARLATLDFRIKPKTFAGRKAKSDRVVLVELFTGAQCPPCVAADLAFDALGKSYKPSEVVLLQYHMHVPAPDPLTSPASVARQGFYEEGVKGAPSIFFSGRGIAGGGGTREDAPEKYDEYLEAIDPMLETPAGASLSLTATRTGPKLSIVAKVDKLTEVGDDIRLRIALVEETVHYKGRNNVPVHHQVVRAMPGGADGTKLGKKTFEKTFDIDITAVRKELTEYLDQFEKKMPFPTKDRPLELKKLRVVAFVQSEKTGEVLQAVQADIKEVEAKKEEPKKKEQPKKDEDD